MTPASIDLLQRQNAPKVLVGDPNQQIYCFRGAVNAMSLIEGSTVFYLTQSFRFGPEVRDARAFPKRSVELALFVCVSSQWPWRVGSQFFMTIRLVHIFFRSPIYVILS